MAAEVSRTLPAELSQPDLFAEMFDEHAAHLFDYCRLLLGDPDDAASATKVTLVAGASLIWCLRDRSRMRAWLFALARRECLSENPARRLQAAPGDEQPAAEPEPETDLIRLSDIADLDRHGRGAGPPALEREIPELVYRHAISAADLPVVLGVPAERVAAVLAGVASGRPEAAGTANGTTANGTTANDPTENDPTENDPTENGNAAVPPAATEAAAQPVATNGDPLAAIPLAELVEIPIAGVPDGLWPDSGRLMLDPNLRAARDAIVARAAQLDADGFPVTALRRKEAARRRQRTAGLLALPAAAGLAGVLFFGHLALAEKDGSHPAGSVTLTDPSAGGSGSTPAGLSSPPPIQSLFPRSAHGGRARKHPGAAVIVPELPDSVTSPAGSSPRPRRHHPSTSPSSSYSPPPSSSPASPSPTPTSPSPTPTSPSPSSSSGATTATTQSATATSAASGVGAAAAAAVAAALGVAAGNRR